MDVICEIVKRTKPFLGFCRDLVLPRLCLVCHSKCWGNQPLCLPCFRSLRQQRWLNWVPAGVRMAAGVPRTWAIYSMGGSVDGLIHSLKYQDYSQSAPFMVNQMWRNSTPEKVVSLLQADWVIPVPLHPARFRDRGFNQSERLAVIVAKKYGFKLANRKMLCRTRYTLTQTRLSEKGRQKNLKTAFTCPNGNSIKGKTFLLVDDVTTTGSTLAACSSALLAAGALEVKALVWAWVPKENP